VVFCLQDAENTEVEERQLVRSFVQKYYNPLLKNPICWIIVACLSVGLLTLSFFGLSKLDVGLEEQVSLVSKSDLYNFFTYEKKYIEVGPPAYVVLEGLDYSNEKDLEMVANISNSLSLLNETV
jgi:Niemann-Pick C1 protein